MTEKADTTKKMVGRSEQDAPSILENSGVMPVTGAKIGGYRQGEPSRVSGRKGKSKRATGVSKLKRRASGAKATGY